MNTISCFQLNAIAQASALAAVTQTVVNLGFLGGNVNQASDSSLGYIHNNALLDTRGFTPLGSGAGNPTLDVNGLPTGAATLCVNTPPSSSAPGPLPPGNYYLNVYSVGQTVTATMNAASGMTLGTGVPQGDGVCIRYPVTVVLASGTQAINFSGAMSQMPDLARDGSVTAVGQPTFSDTALAFYSQMSALRAMDFWNTVLRTDTTWSTRPSNFALHAYGSPHAWEKGIAFFNAVAAYPGSKFKHLLICFPNTADNTYIGNLATLFNTLSPSINLYLDHGDEHWNSSPPFTLWGTNLALAVAELKYLANYGVSPVTITSVTSDGTNLTFNTLNPIDPSYIASPIGSTANCIVVGGVAGFNVGSVASPVVATKTGSNSFTVPSSGSAGAGQFGVIFNVTSTLMSDGQAPSIYQSTLKYYVRLLYQDWQTWSAIRPQDRFIMDLQLYGGQGAGGSQSQPIEYSYAAAINGGSATWLYGSSVGFYVTATANSTADAVFTQMNAALAVNEGYIRSHVYLCKKYGLHPMAYEGGPDTQAIPTLETTVHTDARMGALCTSMWDIWFRNGGEMFCFYSLSPGVFANNAQGAWPSLQSYADTTSPKYSALIAYGSNTITLSNVNSGGVVDVSGHYQAVDARGAVHNGLVGWFDTPPNYVDCLVPIPQAGSYTFTIEGCTGSAATIGVYVDSTNSSNGTSIGTSTLPVAGGGWFTGSSTDALPVSNPVTVTLPVGMHILRMTNPSRTGNGGVGIKDVTYVKN